MDGANNHHTCCLNCHLDCMDLLPGHNQIHRHLRRDLHGSFSGSLRADLGSDLGTRNHHQRKAQKGLDQYVKNILVQNWFKTGSISNSELVQKGWFKTHSLQSEWVFVNHSLTFASIGILILNH